MNIYTHRRRWNWILFSAAIIIVTGSLWYSNVLVNKIARSERNNVRIWANAIQRKANLVAYTDRFFGQIREIERNRAEILADATKNMNNEMNSDVLDIYYKIIIGNKTIPVIQTKDNDSIIHARNVDERVEMVDVLGRQLKSFEQDNTSDIKAQFDIRTIADGTYFFHISLDGEELTLPLVIAR